MKIIQNPSPNFSGRAGYKPEMIVVHCTDGNFPYDMEFLQDPHGGEAGPVSAHFVVAPNGDIHQLVDTSLTAWHAGRVNNPTATLKPGVNPNLYSIGIETSMRSTSQPTKEQVQALKDLIVYLGSEYGIPLDRQHVVGHREIYSLKTCPGTIDVSSLLPANVQAQAIVNAVQKLVPQTDALPEPQRTQARQTLSAILANVLRLFFGR